MVSFPLGSSSLNLDWTPLILSLRATAVKNKGIDPGSAVLLEDLAFYLAHQEEATETIKVGGGWGK